MKLLHVIASMDPKLGGVCQAVRTLIGGLAAQGVHNEVASLDAPAAGWAQADAFPLHALGPGRSAWSYSAKLTPWLLANLTRFDAVVLHGLWLYQGYALHRAVRHCRAQLRKAGTSPDLAPRLFVMPHGMLDPYFQRATGRKLKAWRNWAYWKLLEKRVVNEAAGLLFTCETERQLARQPFAPYHPQREEVVGLGVAAAPPCTPAMRAAFLATCPQLRNRPYLLFISRIHEKKGVELLLQAYARLALAAASPATLPEVPALVIAGPGLETPYGQRMQRLANELPAAAAVYFPGMLTGEAKWGAFYGCEAFVLPSHQENFGIAVVEALACSKPVLISNQVNIWREIATAHGGLVADDTLAGTTELLQRWAQLPAPEKKLVAMRAQVLYQQRFSIEQTARHMQAVVS